MSNQNNSSSTGKIITAVVGGLVIVFVGIFFAGLVTYGNKEIDLRTAFSAQQKDNQVVYDKVWKVIQQKAGVSSEYADKFREIYVQVMDARYGNGGMLMKWITESNPNFNTSLYEDLSLAIESNRSEFARVQAKLIDIKREHQNLRLKFPSSIFMAIKGIKELDMQIVTSTRTDNAFKTGKDDDVGLFNKTR